MKSRIRAKLVDDVSEWRRWWSMRFIILSAFFSAIIAVYATLPADWLPEIAPWLKQALALGAMGTAGAAAVSRVLKQEPKQ